MYLYHLSCLFFLIVRFCFLFLLLTNPVKFSATTGRALRRTTGATSDIPMVVTTIADKMSIGAFYLVITALQKDGLAMDEGFRDNSASPLDDTTKGGSRHAHPCAGLFLGQTLQISQTQGFHLIDGQTHLLYLPQRNPPGFEIADGRIAGDETIFLWSGQMSLH
jgi:hypothetical protein